jgi:hypothetical protein
MWRSGCQCQYLLSDVLVPSPSHAAQVIAARDDLSSFDRLWRCGALPGLVIAACRVGLSGGSTAADMVQHTSLLSAQAQRGWCAASSERQQFALLLLAHVGGRAAAAMLALPENPGSVQLADATSLATAVATLRQAAEQLGQPPLRSLLAQAAPSALPGVDALSSAAPDSSSSSSRTRSCLISPGVQLTVPLQHLELLVALGAQLDPLALDLRLSGCYNPACTSLAGAIESGTKLCKGCKTAR